MNTNGVQFTWNNGRLDSDSVFLRLDRDICNQAWTDFWGGTSCTALLRTHSDHHPLLVRMDLSRVHRTTSFKFFKTWVNHDECRPLVLKIWQQHIIGSGMHRLQINYAKLRMLSECGTSQFLVMFNVKSSWRRMRLCAYRI